MCMRLRWMDGKIINNHNHFTLKQNWINFLFWIKMTIGTIKPYMDEKNINSWTHIWDIWVTLSGISRLKKGKERNLTSSSRELTYASVFTLTEFSGLDWGAVHLDIPKAHVECSPRRTKPARRRKGRNPGDFQKVPVGAGVKSYKVWRWNKSQTIVSSSLLPGYLHLRKAAGMRRGNFVQKTGPQPGKAARFSPVMISIESP